MTETAQLTAWNGVRTLDCELWVRSCLPSYQMSPRPKAKPSSFPSGLPWAQQFEYKNLPHLLSAVSSFPPQEYRVPGRYVPIAGLGLASPSSWNALFFILSWCLSHNSAQDRISPLQPRLHPQRGSPVLSPLTPAPGCREPQQSTM